MNLSYLVTNLNIIKSVFLHELFKNKLIDKVNKVLNALEKMLIDFIKINTLRNIFG